MQTAGVMLSLLKRRSTVSLLLVLCLVFAIFVAKSYMGAVQQNRTRSVAAQFGFAIRELGQAPPGIKRVETFLVRLKTIDTKKAAPEVQQALRDYISNIAASLETARSGQSVARYDQPISQARKRLADAVRENE